VLCIEKSKLEWSLLFLILLNETECSRIALNSDEESLASPPSPDWRESLRPSLDRKAQPDALIILYSVIQRQLSRLSGLLQPRTSRSTNGHTTVTFKVSGFSASQETVMERPLGRFISDRLRSCVSLETGMPADTMARATNSFEEWCLAGLLGPSCE